MAHQRYILTIDVGTGSGRGILFDERGNEVGEARREWAPDPLPGHPGAQCFDPRKVWRLVVECVREVMEKTGVDAGEIGGVTATSMREGMVLYDGDRNVLWACFNADARAVEELKELAARGLGEPLYRTGGDWLNITAPARFLWIRRHMPEVYDRIAHMHMLSDWVLFMLSGEIVTEPSCGSSSGIFDLSRRAWSERLIELFDLPRGIYAPVREPGSVIGTVRRSASEETGLGPHTRVIASGADTQCALLGTGAVKPGMLTVVGGTFWQTTLVTDRPLIDPRFRLRTLCHVVPGQWMTEGIGFWHGFVMRWFRDGFCDREREEARRLAVDPYTLMEEQARAIPPGSGGVQAIFSDVMNARAWKHAVPSLVGFDLMKPEATGKAACIRAIEEGAAYTTRGHVEILEEIAGARPEAATFCGGSSRGELWPQIIADTLGVPVRVPVVKEATSLGSAVCAGRALGWFGSLEEGADSLVRWEREVRPDPEHVEAYHEHYRRWRRAYPYLLAMADDGVLPSLWRAPGL